VINSDRKETLWSLTTWEGAREEQRRRNAALSFEEIVYVQEEMAETARMLQGEDRGGGDGAAEGDVRYGGAAVPIRLDGCRATPLAAYLKALGVLRLVSEQRPEWGIRGRWRKGAFEVAGGFDRQGLVEFFLKEYAPTPILAPWNGGSGFFPKDNQSGIAAIEKGEAVRFGEYRGAIELARRVVADLCADGKPSEAVKQQLLERCRREFPERALDWLDSACLVLDEKSKYPPLLGTGGNDGRLDFTNNFMQRLGDLLDATSGEPRKNADALLGNALFAASATGLRDSAIGQFFPFASGGFNSGTGFVDKALMNPWDFVLMLEGAIAFSAAGSKRLRETGAAGLAYPFCTTASAVGYGSASDADEAGSRGEIWMPLWEQAASYREVRALLGEGRAEVSGSAWAGGRARRKFRAARTGVDFARAAVTLGVDRGISEFQRYVFDVRNGLAYFATPLEPMRVRRNVRVDLLADVDGWLQALRRAVGSGEGTAQASVKRALRRLEGAIFQLCRVNPSESSLALQDVLIGLGECAAVLGRCRKWTVERGLRPAPVLRPDWVRAAGQGAADQVEFRLAASLAGMGGTYEVGMDRESRWLPMRSHLEPVVYRGGPRGRRWYEWDSHDSREVVWHQRSVEQALQAVLARRLVLAGRAQSGKPLPDLAKRPASLRDVVAFLDGSVDEERFAALLRGLALVDWWGAEEIPSPDRGTTPKVTEDRVDPPSLYALLKLCFVPGLSGGRTVPAVAAIHTRACAGEGAEASRLAARTLRAHGVVPAIGELEMSGREVVRIAAALTFPLHRSAIRGLEQQVLRPSESEETEKT